jgi:hypothetical protein
MELASSRTEALRVAALAGLAAVAVATLAPPGGDAPAHLYRTELVRDGVHVWDNLWFGGHYPLASYSLLYYLPTALVGNVPVVVAAAIASAVLFAWIATDEWGRSARWPARAFGVLAAGPLYTGTYSYALGLAAALGALRLLQLRRPWLAVACSGLALGFSPLAFAFLVVALTAVLVARRPRGRATLVVAGGLSALAAAELVIVTLFPSEGRYPFSPLSLAAVLTASALGAGLAARSERARVLGWFFVLWATVNLVAFFVPSPFGDNLTRLRALLFPLVLLTALVVRFRPRWLAVGAVCFALFYNLGPDVEALPKRIDDARTADAAFWEPALGFLRRHADPDFRVEVVPTFGHWEAYWIPRSGFSLARGWYRQLDLAENPELYELPLSAASYRAWLRRMGVRYVLVPDARLGPMGATREADLVRSGHAGLVEVFGNADWTIYELPGAAPILTGPGRGRIDRLEHERIEGWTAAAGTYRLRVRYTRYWRVVRGHVCLARASDDMTLLVVRRPGRFALAAPEEPGRLVRSLLGARGARC